MIRRGLPCCCKAVDIPNNATTTTTTKDSSPKSAATLKLRHRHRPLTLMDRVYEHITIPPLITEAIDTRQFQRLRGLKQLGVSSYLYPGAVHTRFEHSIGVAHLASQFLSNLHTKQPELQITEDEKLNVMLAGLAHDLGHGPFSHLFEDVIMGSLGKGVFCHENMSQKLLRGMLGKGEGGLGLDDARIDAVAAIMSGDTSKSRFAQIISNKKNGVDVDRIDYFVRDSMSCFGKPTVDVRVNRLFNSTMLVQQSGASGLPQWELAFEEKMALTLRDLFALRAKLHKYVYQHQVVKCIGHMIGDALQLAHNPGNFTIAGRTLSECAADPELFMMTGDWIVESIEHSVEASLKDARRVLQRLRQRQLYPLVFNSSLAVNSKLSQAELKQSILDHQSKRVAATGVTTAVDATFTADDIIVDLVKINHGCGAVDPLTRMTFFNPKKKLQKGGSGVAINNVVSTSTDDMSVSQIVPGSSPLFSPSVFEERTALVFVRTPGKEQAVRQAVEDWRRSPLIQPHLAASLPSLNASD